MTPLTKAEPIDDYSPVILSNRTGQGSCGYLELEIRGYPSARRYDAFFEQCRQFEGLDKSTNTESLDLLHATFCVSSAPVFIVVVYTGRRREETNFDTIA